MADTAGHWRIEPIPLHRFRVPAPEVLFQRGFGDWMDLAIHAFLLIDEGGRCVLVDTGLTADHAALDADIRARKGAAAGFDDVGPGLAAELAARDARPEDVLLTSFGPYVTGGLPLLPGARVFASHRGLAELTAPEEPALFHAPAAAVRTRLHAAVPVVDRSEVLPGVTLVEVGVHHAASAAVLVRTAAGVVAIADPVFATANLVQGIALGVAEHAAGWHRMVRRLGAAADAIMPIHDPMPHALARAHWHPSLHGQPWATPPPTNATAAS